MSIILGLNCYHTDTSACLIKNGKLEFAIEEDKKMELGFSLKYLHDICLYQKICKNISIGISDTSPLKASYMLDNDASLSFYLAPKVDDD